MKTPSQILRISAVSERTGLPRSSMYRAISEGTFPRPINLGTGRAVGWLESSIETWINDRVAASSAS